MENYAFAKSRLFACLEPGKKKKSSFARTAVMNADDFWHKPLLKECRAKVLTYGLSSGADVQAKDIQLTPTGTHFKLNYQGTVIDCHLPLIGRHNVYNFLAAACVGVIRQVPLEVIAQRIATVPSVPGRLEPIPNELGIKVYVDFAHSDDALVNIFDCLKEIKTRRLIAVFGCGGDRDQNKRPLMAKVCEDNCEISIVTSDNPRTEDPAVICSHILQGFKNKESYLVELDRKNAIVKAIELAEPGDIVLIAGKGHETSQIFAHQTVEFDDRKVAWQACEKRRQACVIS
jgi:UDP-N-acetylmuramoyl-L-alanyl-D-glutamate--2,6-diaminopimelate ligase